MTHSAADTQRVAAKFAASLPSGAVVGLIGPLGVGKTTFIQGMATGLGIDPNAYVTSPSFALIHEYNGPKFDLYHFDLYRLTSFEGLVEIGWEDYAARDGIVVVEWADRFPELESELTHRVVLRSEENDKRLISIGAGPVASQLPGCV